MKLACVSFYKNVTERNLPAGSGVFVVVDAAMGCPLGIFQENRVSKYIKSYSFVAKISVQLFFLRVYRRNSTHLISIAKTSLSFHSSCLVFVAQSE